MILTGQNKPRDEFGKSIPDPIICLSCIEKMLGEAPGSLTWAFGVCPVCDQLKICTKQKYILALKGAALKQGQP